MEAAFRHKDRAAGSNDVRDRIAVLVFDHLFAFAGNEENYLLGSGMIVPLMALSRLGDSVTFGIRPEDIEIAPGAGAEAQVHDVENQGVEQIVTLRAGSTLLRAAVPARIALSIEETVRFGWRPEKVLLFDPESGRNLGHAA
jgi:hypothetical protein